MSQLTIRDLDPRVEELIRLKAQAENQSLSTVVGQLLRVATGLEPSTTKKRSLRGLGQFWSPDEAAAFQKTHETFEQIDDEVWK